MDGDDPDSASDDLSPDTSGARGFHLVVWPGSSARRWRAEITADGRPPLRFDRVFDLVVFLTDLSASRSPPPAGLR